MFKYYLYKKSLERSILECPRIRILAQIISTAVEKSSAVVSTWRILYPQSGFKRVVCISFISPNMRAHPFHNDSTTSGSRRVEIRNSIFC